MDIQELISVIENNVECTVFKPSGLPELPSLALKIPQDLKRFYELCGGIVLFPDRSYSFEIVSVENLKRANPIIAKTEGEDDKSYNWFIISKSGDGQYVTIDLSEMNNGKCYDSFWDRYGLIGDMPVIASNFTELLLNLYQSMGEELYWINPSFDYMGDAYD